MQHEARGRGSGLDAVEPVQRADIEQSGGRPGVSEFVAEDHQVRSQGRKRREHDAKKDDRVGSVDGSQMSH
jgi:hypothetical protein